MWCGRTTAPCRSAPVSPGPAPGTAVPTDVYPVSPHHRPCAVLTVQGGHGGACIFIRTVTQCDRWGTPLCSRAARETKWVSLELRR